MNLKSAFMIALAASGVFAVPAHAAPVWTITAEGLIASGTDTAGIFGNVGQNLLGAAFKQTISVSVDPKAYSDVKIAGANSIWLSGTFPGFVESITVNGKTVDYAITQPLSGSQMITTSSVLGGYYQDQFYSSQVGNDDRKNQVFAVISAFTFNSGLHLVPAADFSRTITASGALVDTHATASATDKDGHQLFSFYAFPRLITVNGKSDANDVPEPATATLFGFGALAIVATRRRKQAKT